MRNLRNSLCSPAALAFVLPLALGLNACADDPEMPAGDRSASPPTDSQSPPRSTGSGAASPGAPVTPAPPVVRALTSSQGRLLVGDGDPENPRMIVVDLDEGKSVATYPTLGSTATYRSRASSRYAYANQRVHGLVEILDSGIGIDGSSGAIVKQTPSIVTERFEGALPTHWVHHDDWIVSFNDGDGSFDYMLEPTLAGGRLLKHRATTGRKHHGVAVIARGNVFATLPDPNDAAAALPVGVTMRRIATPDSVVKQSDQCPALHGEAGNDDTVAFGCADGILLAERKGTDFEFRKLPNPPGAPTGQRVGTIRMMEGLPRLVGNWGNGVVIVDASTTPATWTAVDFGAANVGFFVTEDAKHLVALDGSGALRQFDALTGAAVGAPLPVIESWAPPQLRPSLALGDGKAFIADPRAGKVIEVDLATATKQRTFDIGGQPSSVAAFARVTLP